MHYPSSALGDLRTYLHADHQGSIIALSNKDGTGIQKLTYDSFGIPKISNANRFGYTGQIWFKELGLFYYKARMYDPILGRFLQTDPVFYADNMNMYADVGNDPINKNDPTGLFGYYPGFNELSAQFSGGVLAVTSTIADFTPGIGDAKAIGEAIATPSTVNVTAAVAGVVPIAGDATAKAIKMVGNVPKPPTGRGAVPPSQRDPQRAFTQQQKTEKLNDQQGKCAGCDKDLGKGEGDGHHVDRHADGGATTKENLAVVCEDFHKELHRK